MKKIITALLCFMTLASIASASAEIYFSPSKDCTQAIIRAVAATPTGQTVLIEDYNFTHPEILTALQDALKRGVKITAMLDRGANLTNKNSIAGPLAAAGASVVYDGKHPIAHIKCFIFPDRAEAWLGSFNATRNAEKNHECWCKANPEDVPALIKDFQAHLAHSNN